MNGLSHFICGSSFVFIYIDFGIVFLEIVW